MLIGTNQKIVEILGVKCKPIPDTENYYAGIDGFIYSTCGKQPRKLKGNMNSKGYLRVVIKGKPKFVHHLVALAWLGKRPSKKHQCCHTNDIKIHNQPDNLHYGLAGFLGDHLHTLKNGRITTLKWTNAFDAWFKNKKEEVISDNGWLNNDTKN